MRRTMTTLAAAAALTLLATTGLAQRGTTDRVRTGPDEIAGVTFSGAPYRVESMGLSVRLPEGVTVSSTSTTDGVRSFVATPGDNTWLLRVLSPRVSDGSLTPADVTDSMIGEIVDPDGERDGNGARGRGGTMDEMSLTTKDGRKKVFGRVDDLKTASSGDGAAEGSRFYVSITQPSGTEMVTGFTVFRPAPGMLLVFEINCLRSEFASARPVYEAIVATAEIRDPEELASERAAGVVAGETLLADLDGEAIASLLPVGPEWTRVYEAGPTGRWGDDTEVAYRKLEIREGRRGELARTRGKSSWSASEREKGFVAEVLARYLEGERTIDVLSTYFLSEDKASEAWSVRMRVRDRFDEFSWTETGVRSKGEVRVSIAQPDGTVTDKAWPTPPEGYLSHVEALLLPRVLAERGVEGTFAYYRYNTQLGELTLRRDTFEASDNGWTLTTRPHEDAPEETRELTSEGALVRGTLGEGVRTAPIGQRDLLRIWRHKGLPVE